MRIKAEVKKICLEFMNEKVNTKRWKELAYELQHKWRFTAYNLLALFQNPPIIEYTDENKSLIFEKE